MSARKLLPAGNLGKIKHLLRNAGFCELEFRWDERPSEVATNQIVSAVVHVETQACFLFDLRADHHHAVYRLSADETLHDVRTESWGRQFTEFRAWLNRIQKMRYVSV